VKTEPRAKLLNAAADSSASDEDLPEAICPPSGSRTKARETIWTSAEATTPRRGKQSKTTPKRAISVLSPSLAMSGGLQYKGKKKADDSVDELDRNPRHGSQFPRGKVTMKSSLREQDQRSRSQTASRQSSGSPRQRALSLVGKQMDRTRRSIPRRARSGANGRPREKKRKAESEGELRRSKP
jgi:hypothetical protein